jgi:O-antigen/teichoic acid export membrane protein
MRLRRALLVASADRYVNLLIGFVLVAVISRLLTPKEIGVSLLGAIIIALVELVRDVPSTYLVQRQTLTATATRAAFSIMMSVSLVAATALALASGWIAAAYDDPGMAQYALVVAATLLLGPFERPPLALLRREMAFGRLALVNLSNIFVNAAVTIGLGATGFGYMSFAWGMLAAYATSVVLANALNPKPWIYVPHFSGWREPIRLGLYSSAFGLLRKSTEALPFVVLGQQLNSLGHFGRALTLADIPDKLILAGVLPVAYPAIAAEHHAGRGLKVPMLLAMGHITAVAWPAYLLLACLASPVVGLLLGPHWTEVVPILQILALAKLLMFFDALIFSVLFTVGALRGLVFSAMVPLPFFVLLVLLTAGSGPVGLALCVLAVSPIYCLAGLVNLRRAVPFAWRELLAPLGRSAGVTACSMVGPLLVLAQVNFQFDLTLLAAAAAAGLAALGWLFGLWLTGHPLLREVLQIVDLLRDGPLGMLRKLNKA